VVRSPSNSAIKAAIKRSAKTRLKSTGRACALQIAKFPAQANLKRYAAVSVIRVIKIPTEMARGILQLQTACGILGSGS